MATSVEVQTLAPPPPRAPEYPRPGTRFDLLPEAFEHGPRDLGFQSAQWNAAFLGLCLVVFAVTSATYVLSLTGNLSVEGDNAIYIILAKAMVAGHGYTNIQGPVPRIEAQYPFLFPVMLAPIVRIFGIDGIVQMQALVTGFALAAFATGVFLFRRWTGSGMLALGIMVAAMESDIVWSFSHKVLTEVPYLFLSLATCLLAARYAEQTRWLTWTCLCAGTLAALAYLTRTIGISLCVAVPLYLLIAPPLGLRTGGWRLRLMKAVAVSVPIVVAGGGWTLRNRIVFTGQGHNYIGQFFLKQAYVPDAGSVNSSGLFDRMAANVGYYADQFQRMVGGHVWDHVPEYGNLSHALIIVAVLGFVYAALRRRTVAEPYVGIYVLIVLLWPWQDLRFAVPLMPFLFYYLALAISLPMLILARLRPIDPRVAAAMVLIPLSIPTGIHTLHIAQTDRASGYHYQLDRLGEWQGYPDWRDFHAAATWLKANALPGSTVINRSPNIFYLWTGLPSRNYPYTFDTTDVMQNLSVERVDYVILDNFAWTYTTNLYLRPTIKRFPTRFVPLKEFNGTIVYQVIPSARGSAHRLVDSGG